MTRRNTHLFVTVLLLAGLNPHRSDRRTPADRSKRAKRCFTAQGASSTVDLSDRTSALSCVVV